MNGRQRPPAVPGTDGTDTCDVGTQGDPSSTTQVGIRVTDVTSSNQRVPHVTAQSELIDGFPADFRQIFGQMFNCIDQLGVGSETSAENLEE